MGKEHGQDSCKMGTRAAPRARTRRARTPEPRPIALRVRSRPCEQGTHAHALKISRTISNFTSAFTSAISLLLGASEFSSYDPQVWNVDGHPRAPAVRTAKTTTPAVEKARSMGRVDRHDVNVKSAERRRAFAQAAGPRATAALRLQTCARCRSPHTTAREPRATSQNTRAPCVLLCKKLVKWGWLS